MLKYFLYIRKSTDEEDKQVLSLEAQETELLELAKKERLDVIEVFRESQTAKEPGRKIFNQMLERIEHNEAQGILAWHPDRLARNSVDGGRIIFLTDSAKILSLKFPTFWFEPTPQGKFMLNIAFGQSKYFVDNLSENIKRGLRQKIRRGEWPGWAPIGYLNDYKAHTVVPDPERFKLIKRIFELYSTDNYSLKDVQNQITKNGLLSKAGKMLSISMIQTTLTNPFYYGLMKYNDELHQGRHKPMITKKLFDECQRILKDRSWKKVKTAKVHAFRGLLKCAECGCAITSETQKEHNYYRCTKKKISCSQPYVREENLAEQISKLLQKVSLSSALAKKMINHLDKEKETNSQAEAAFAQNLKSQIRESEDKLDKLLDAHLEGVISKDEYTTKKQKILNQKIEKEEKLSDFEQKPNHWLELCRDFILAAQQAKIIALQGNFFAKRNFLKKIGSNPLLRDKKILFKPQKAWEILWNWNAERQRREANNLQPTTWLPLLDSNFRLFISSTLLKRPLGEY